MTQSGISQQIAKLEVQVGQPLFVRVNKAVSLTDSGQLLLDYIERQQDELEKLFEEMGHGTRSLSGLVRYGMPHSCIFTPHFPLLLEAREKFPNVHLKVDLCPNEDVIDKIIRRELDFGFLTRKSENPALDHDLFAYEEYALIGKKGALELKTSVDVIRRLPFVNYPGMRNLFEIWRADHFPMRRSLNFESLTIAGEINSLHGAVTMISQGVGWSVVPTHVVGNELKRNEVHFFPGTETKKIRSEIHIVSLKGNRQPARVRAVLEAFSKMKKG
jgi:DNA-binding transcriptional LysR family regulator